MIEVLIYILLALVVLLVIILVAPIHFAGRIEYAESFNLQGQVRWAGGLLSIELMRSEGTFHGTWGFLGWQKAISKNEAKSPDSKSPPGSKKPRTPKKSSHSKSDLSAFMNPQLFVALKNVFLKLVQALHLKLQLSGIYGFDDPSLTGVMVGAIAALNRDSSFIDLDPDFTREVVDIRGSIGGWLSPLQIIVIGLGFIFKKPVRAIWWPKIKFRKKQKEAVQYA